MHSATRLHHAGTVTEARDLQPLFTSWEQAAALLRQRVAAVRTRLRAHGDVPQHRLHLPCRHSGGTYALPVALSTPPSTTTPGPHNPEVTQVETPEHLQLTVCDHESDPRRDWQQDAAAARFAVLATGNQQMIVELVPGEAPSTTSPAPSPHALTLRVILPAPYRAPVAAPPPSRALPPVVTRTQAQAASVPWTATTAATDVTPGATPGATPRRTRLPILT